MVPVQPYLVVRLAVALSVRWTHHRAGRTVCLLLIGGGLAAACGSTSVTNVTAPDESRCAASVTADPVTVSPDGGTVTVTVSAERECTWSARSDASWLALRQTSGQGNSAITATAARNEQPVPRSASLTVNDQRLTIAQQPRPCDLALQGFAPTIPPSGGTGTVRVTTISGCGWLAVSSAPWLLVQTASGSGSADIRFNVLANDGAAREATITVGGQSAVITQAAAVTAPVCSYAIDTPSQAFPVSGGAGTVAVSTQAECAWTASGGTDWVTLLTASGTGAGEARYQVSANPTTEPRQATLTIAGRVHTVTQPGLSCSYTIDRPGDSFAADGGPGSLQVNTLGGCAWTATSNAGWIVVGTGAGSGPGQIAYQVLPNALTSARTGTITVGGQTHTVTQAAALPPCTYGLDPVSAGFAAAGGSGTVTVNTTGGHCSWTAESSAAWITIAGGSGSGSGTSAIAYTVAANTATAPRTGTITIAGQTHTVTQDAAAPACSLALDPTSSSFPAAGGPGTVTVKTGPTCAWTAASSDTWITVQTPSGTGTGTVGYTVGANTTTAARTGTIVIGGATHTVTQAAAAPVCSIALDPTASSFPETGGPGTVTVKTGPTCTWTAASPDAWIAVQTPQGTGTGTVGYTVATNTTTAARTGTIVIGGATHTVTQAAATPVCTYTVSPGTADVAAGASQGTVTVTTQPGCAWTATSSVAWVTLTPGPAAGSGTTTVGYTVAENLSTLPRSGTITIAGQALVITQAGAAATSPVGTTCTYSITPEDRSFGSLGGVGEIVLTTGATCAWTAVSNAGWVTVLDASGIGSAAIAYVVSASGGTRSATITVGGQTHRITQTSMALP